MAAPPSSFVSSSVSASRTAVIRLMSDLKTIQTEIPAGYYASPVSEDDLFEWSATIYGPYGTPWEGGLFEMRLTFPASYPQRPPEVRFVSEVFHPNVCTEGVVCMDIIRNAWSPCHTVSSILTSIQSLLNDPNASHPRNPEAAHLFMTNRKAYNRRVRSCAKKSTELPGPSSSSQQ